MQPLPFPRTEPAHTICCAGCELDQRRLSAAVLIERRHQLQYFFRQFDPELSRSEYEAACASFVEDIHASASTDPSLRGVLSNPMDLSIAAQLLGLRRKPEMFRLQDQQYELMAAEYRRLYPDRSFPLERFCELVYEHRIVDSPIPDESEFADELELMARFKLVVARFDATKKREWYFRHDKIRDYFLTRAFLGADNKRPLDHLDDPRFRGVYVMLALVLPEAAAVEHSRYEREWFWSA